MLNFYRVIFLIFQVTEKIRIHQTKLYQSLNADVSRSNYQMSFHKCIDCNYKLDAAEF